MVNNLKRQYLARMKALHAWARRNEGQEIQTDSFYFDRNAKELYYMHENRPTRVTLASYQDREELRDAMDIEMAVQLGVKVPDGVSALTEKIAELTEAWGSISTELKKFGYRLKLGRDGTFSAVESGETSESVEDDQPNKEDEDGQGGVIQ